MQLDYSFVKEITALGSEIKAIKLTSSGLLVFNQSLSSELNSPPEWRHESSLFGAIYTEAVEKKDYSATFRQLCKFDTLNNDINLRDQFIHRQRFDEWAKYYKSLLEQGIEHPKGNKKCVTATLTLCYLTI